MSEAAFHGAPRASSCISRDIDLKGQGVRRGTFEVRRVEKMTYPGDSFDETRLSRALVSNNDNAGQVDVNVRSGAGIRTSRSKKSVMHHHAPYRPQFTNKLDQLFRTLAIVAVHQCRPRCHATEGFLEYSGGWRRRYGAVDGRVNC